MSTLELGRPVGVRRPAAYVAASLAFLGASAGVAACEAAGRVPHGWWLVAFLGLVGGVAQLLLGAGHEALAPRGHAASSGRQALLWNAGTLLVPLGVLADARVAVVCGSVLLLAALGGFSRSLLRAHRAGHPPRWHLAYLGLLAFMSASVVVGTALAWDRPWL